MATKNDITGDTIATKSTSEKYRDGWERIFGKKHREKVLDELAAEAQKLGFYEEKQNPLT